MRRDPQPLQLMTTLLHRFIAALVARVFIGHGFPDTEHRPPAPALAVEPVGRTVRGTDATVGVATRVDEAVGPGHGCAGRQKSVADFNQAIVVAGLAVTIKAGGLTGLRVGRAVDAVVGLVPEAIDLRAALEIPRLLLATAGGIVRFNPRAFSGIALARDPRELARIPI